MHVRTALFFFVLAIATSAHAQQISPLIYELASSGPDARRELSVANTGNSPIAFEISVTRRSYTENGDAVDVPVADQLTVSPSAIWVEPGASKKVVVRYTGAATVDQSSMYLVTFRQAPVRLTERDGRDGISLQYEFATIAHLVPANTAPQLAVEAVNIDEGRARVTIANRGRRYGRIDSGALTLGGPKTCVVLSREILANSHNATWILPGEARSLVIDLPQDCPTSGLRAEWRSVIEKPAE